MVLQAQQEHRVPRDLKVFRVKLAQQERQELKARLVLQEQLVLLELLALRVPLVHRA